MAVHHLLAQVNIPRDAGLQEDVSVNGWHFAWEDTGAYATRLQAATEIRSRLDIFYTDLSNFFSARNNNPVTVRVYDMGDPEPRIPIILALSTMVFSTGALPSEVAIVLSFHSTIASGDTPARRRGRVYLGPLTSDIVGTGAADSILVASAQDEIVTAAQNLMGENVTDSSLLWSQFSEADLGTLLPVTGGWVDNAFDTQRRRGSAPTVRDTF